MGVGVGFAKTAQGNLEVMSGLQRIRSQLQAPLQGMPMLLGPSRKGFLGKLTGTHYCSVFFPVEIQTDAGASLLPPWSALQVSVLPAETV